MRSALHPASCARSRRATTGLSTSPPVRAMRATANCCPAGGATDARMTPAGTDSYGALVEREQELSTLDRLVDAAAEGDGRMVLIEGPAGIGKTRLLAEARRLAKESGMLVVAARAGELEREFPYGVVRQLFEARLAVPEVADTVFAGAAGASRSVFDTVAAEEAEDSGGFATLHALYWLALNLGNEQPLFIEVDDIQWCDRPS